MMGVCQRSLLILLCTGFTLPKQRDVHWTPPSGWTGPAPAFYQSFDTTKDLNLMAGTKQIKQINPLVSGKKDKAIRLDAKQRQWIDLGIQDVCLSQPDTCGKRGGALSMLVKVGPGNYTGIITSRQKAYTDRGFTLGRIGPYFITKPAFFDFWFHVVINYFGPNDGQGFKTYFNGDLSIFDNTKRLHDTTPSNGKIVIGRFFADIDDYYTSMDVDELLFFNHTLSTQEINSLIFNCHKEKC